MPEPSRLVLLEQLHSAQPGTKVRFLACVHAYIPHLAQLTLRDKYPATAADAPIAFVNVDNILENVRHELLEVGAWLNVVGYVRETFGAALTPDAAARTSFTNSDKDIIQSRPTIVEATMLWTAQNIKLDKYQSAVRDYQKPLIDDQSFAKLPPDECRPRS